MCGIAGIIVKRPAGINLSEAIVAMTQALRHRGPDGEGFITATPGAVLTHFHTKRQKFTRSDLSYIPYSPINTAPADSFLAFAHRRLSIIDLSEGGHQPMCNSDKSLWITFNGEIYNYIELKQELLALGHRFASESDTEVILAAYRQWGNDCVKRFNGMWAFCIYDLKQQVCFASRDRLGVKPFYYLDNQQLFAFASEQKAFVAAGLVKAGISEKSLHSYLLNGITENEPSNFFEGVSELFPGHNLVYDLNTKRTGISSYYRLQDHINLSNDGLSDRQLIEKVRAAFESSVKLRLRSDVEVGVCLSGGIDSSALAVTIAGITGLPVSCFTAVFKDQPFNEEYYADKVAEQIGARHYKTEPALEDFMAEVDDLVYSQDVPIWSTSTYAQHRVMSLAKQQQVKVVLDGQGADELFAGYHHHFAAKWNSLTARGNYTEAFKEIAAARKSIPHPFLFYAKERLKQRHHFRKKHFPVFFKEDFIERHAVKNPWVHFENVNAALLSDIYETRLKSFLKCEDRCGMWHSVESRTPFSDDVELMNLLFSFNGDRKIRNGISKYLLREAVKDKLPPEIYNRHDKRGFETPMQQWMNALRSQIVSEVKNAGFDFVNYRSLEKADPGNAFHNSLLFKLFVLCRWQKVFKASL